ncbi:FAD-dependent oxidoreductase [Microcoleus sp. F8-D3]
MSNSAVKPNQMIDVAVVGGGVSGAYAAWRLASHHKSSKIRLYELSDRIGGRLLSMTMPGMPHVQAELGGMYVTESQAIVWELIKLLNLKTTVVDFSSPGVRAYVRDRHLLMSEFNQPDKVPYNLRPDEAGKNYEELFELAVGRAIPDKKLTAAYFASPEWKRDRETLKIDGQHLYDLSIWEVLLKEISNEAYNLCLDTGFFYSDLGTWNAASAIATSISLPYSDTWYMIADGYQKLPETLAAKFEGEGGEVCLNHRLKTFDRTSEGLIQLNFVDRAGRSLPPVLAKHLILAMPKRSLELLAVENQHNFLFSNSNFRRNIQTVSGDPAYKLFLGYHHPWWHELDIHGGTSATDLPMQKCYYFGTESAQGGDPNNHNSLLLSVFSDNIAAGFWQTMAYNPDRPEKRPAFRGEQGETRELRAFLTSDGSITTDPLVPSQDMVRTAQRQLKALHNSADIPEPYTALYIDWQKDPYGGGWHSWNPRCQPWEVMKQMRHPIRGANVYVCGEAYSNMQGWVQGALNSAELMLEENFNLSRSAWLPPSYDLGS